MLTALTQGDVVLLRINGQTIFDSQRREENDAKTTSIPALATAKALSIYRAVGILSRSTTSRPTRFSPLVNQDYRSSGNRQAVHPRNFLSLHLHRFHQLSHSQSVHYYRLLNWRNHGWVMKILR